MTIKIEKKTIENVITFPKPDFVFKDDRGSLKQLVSGKWSQINFNTSVAGSIRGGHFHKENREMFFVISGKFTLTLKAPNGPISFIMEKEDFFIIEKNISHSFEFIDETLLIAAYDLGVVSTEPNKPIDIFRDE
jgi:dTDP-4-dehydrorhamnose 3,5-epimerase-like enzyme